MKERYLFFICILSVSILLTFCKKDNNDGNWIISDYSGSYKNIEFSESLLKEYTPGIYKDEEIPEELKQLSYGRIEIDFRYNGGALASFMPLFYYGSINKNNHEDDFEEPDFHMAIEIGHYNVIPSPVEFLFYTICTNRWPQYCRDTYFPIIAGKDYTVVIDKKPEGMILQLKEGVNIVNIFPHAFFPDSSQMFFKDVTAYTEAYKGDSLEKVLMVGKGFAGFDMGLHTFNGSISRVRIYKYDVTSAVSNYELNGIRNQNIENQQLIFNIKDHLYANDKYVIVKHEFWPYKFESGMFKPNGQMQTNETKKILINKTLTYNIKPEDMGFYKLYVKTVDNNGTILGSSSQPFEIWVYPKEWNFKFY
jgi:hypothetical protein